MEPYDKGQEFRAMLEQLLDITTPALLIEALAVIATEKADYVRSCWQDEPTAKLWEKISKSLDRETGRLLKIGDPYS